MECHEVRKRLLLPIRLTRREARLIWVGLARIIAEYKFWQANGPGLHTHTAVALMYAGFDKGVFDPASMAALDSARGKAVAVTAATKRCRMDARELAACILGVRLCAAWVRHGHITAWLPNHAAASRKLLRKLERHRKRAKRLHVRQLGAASFAQPNHDWRRFVRWLRVHVLHCSHGRPFFPEHVRNRSRLRKLIVRGWVAFAKDYLTWLEIPLPSNQELERLAKDGMRHGRRLLRRVGMLYATSNRDFIPEQIAKYIERRCLD